MDQPSPYPQKMRAEAALRREMIAGERLIWSAQPMASRLKGGFGIWLFAIPWTAFALFWETMALSPWFAGEAAPNALMLSVGIIFPLFGLPFIAVGGWMLWKPIAAMRKAGDTIYALTERRLIRVVTGRTTEVESVMIDQIGPVQRRVNADGSGDLSIQTHSRIDSEGDRVTERFIVMGVPDVARLEHLIIAAQPDA